MADNYRMLFDQSRERFLTYDQQAMIDHFKLAHDEENFYFHILGSPAVLERKTGVITYGGAEAGFNEACTAYDILSRAADRPVLSGRWVSIVDLGGNTASHHVEHLVQDLSSVEGHLEEKKALCRSWGGVEQRQGDLSFIVPLFDFFPVWIQFWEGEEELGIPAKFKCIWDAATLDFMFYETTWYAHGYLQGRLTGKGGRW